MTAAVNHPDALVTREAREVLSVRARSFRWGAVFLPASVRDDAAILYAFCRLADDLADEAPDRKTAIGSLAVLRAELGGERAGRPVVRALLDVFARRRTPMQPAFDLLTGVESDLHDVRIADDAALLLYCYRVAGTVGLLMAGVLGVRAAGATEPALALGRAMQLTNICRDVSEDAGLGRVYLPATRLASAGLTGDDVVTRRAPVERIAPVLVELLSLADAHYAAADAGMHFIPARSRLGILVAAGLYQEIGREIGRRGFNPWAGRAVVPAWRKGWVVFGAFGRFLRSVLR